MPNATAPLTANRLVARYAADIAFVAEETPATTVDAFTDQLRTAYERMNNSGLTLADDLDIAAGYLDDAEHATDPAEQQTLLRKAADLMRASPTRPPSTATWSDPLPTTLPHDVGVPVTSTALCNLTVDEALGMAQEMAERAEAADNETGTRYAAIGQIYADIAAIRQHQTQQANPATA
ncbi:hypothetical protein [Streptomyces gardneri]|uniref:hypothetical protein n=1 Tax=Streptomyces gardneri TaxID=66892 RepID=UPI00367C4170